jgi:hypothetical protein
MITVEHLTKRYGDFTAVGKHCTLFQNKKCKL